MNRNKETKRDENQKGAYSFLRLNSKATLIIGKNTIFLYLQSGQVTL